MVWRKWLVRLLVFSIAGMVALTATVYRHFTNPTAVREQVIARLQEHLPGARVEVEYAALHLMGGISFQELRLFRKDDPNQKVFLEVPNGTIYHDKEQLLNGKVVIRKVEFDKPWLRVVREEDGSWNLNGILGAVDLSKSIPTIVLKQATVFLEDKKTSPPVAPLEIKDVNLAILNDPRDTLRFDGSGLCDLIGTIQIGGHLGRATDQFKLSLLMPDVPVGGDLVQRLGGYQAEAAEQLRLLTGKLKNLQVDLMYDPHSSPAWNYAIRARMAEGRLGHAQLPMMLEQVEGDISMINGRLSLKKVSAHFGETRIELAGSLIMRPESVDLEDGMLTVSRLVIDEALMQHMPPQIDELNKLFRPRGPISFYIEAERHAGKWKTRTHVEPEGMRAACQKFPYELDNIRGMVEQENDPENNVNLIKIDLVGHSGPRAVSVRGKMGDKGPGSVAVHVTAKDLQLDAKMHAALPPDSQKIVDSFQPKGLVDVDVDVTRQANSKEFQNRIVARFHDTTVSYELFPYPIERVSGVLEIMPGHWEFHDFVGIHAEGRFLARGGSFPIPGQKGNELRIELAGDQIRLDEQMAAALKQQSLQQTWKALNPSGHIGFEAKVTQRSPEPADIVVSVRPQHGCRIKPTVFPYPLDIALEPKGHIKYDKRHVYLNGIICQHNETTFVLKEGNVTCKEHGGVSIDLEELVGNPVVPDGELVAALPGALGSAVKVMELRDRLSLRLVRLAVDVSIEGEKPVVYWDGSVGLDKAFLRLGVPLEQVTGVISCKGEYRDRLGPIEGHVKLRQATLFKQPFENLHANFNVNVARPNLVLIPDLHSKLYGGDVSGLVTIDLEKNLAFEVDLKANQVQLEGLGRQIGTKSQLSGMATASLYLRGSGTDISTLQGHGTADVMNGKIYNLPALVALLKVLKLRLPDDTAFEEAHIQFGMNGRQIEFSRIDFFGDAVSLGGRGGMNLDGSNLMVDFFALPGPLNTRMLPVIGNLEAAISKQVLSIKLRGSLQDPKPYGEPMPFVLEPVKGMMNWIRSRNGMATRE